MAKIKDIIIELEKKAEAYNKAYLPSGWTKSIDSRDSGFMLISPDRKKAFKFDSIYVATLMQSTKQYFWGYTSGNLAPEMKKRTEKIKEVGEAKRVLELMEGSLLVEDSIVEMQKITRKLKNEENCMMVHGDFCSKYTVTELMAMSSSILKPDSFIVLDFPDHDFSCFYFLYGKPTEIKL